MKRDGRWRISARGAVVDDEKRRRRGSRRRRRGRVPSPPSPASRLRRRGGWRADQGVMRESTVVAVVAVVV